MHSLTPLIMLLIATFIPPHPIRRCQVYDEIPKDLLELVEDAVLCRRPDATERLLARAEEEKARLEAAKEAAKAGGVVAAGPVRTGMEWRDKPVGERLTYSLVKGASRRVPSY